MVMFSLLLKSFSRRQRSAIASILCMVFLAVLCAFSSSAIFFSGKKSVLQKMNSLGFGDFTILTNSNDKSLVAEVAKIDGVKNVTAQKIIFSGYEITGVFSDNDGELILPSEQFHYNFIDENGEKITEQTILPGTIFISPALKSRFDVEIGSKINFEISAIDKTDGGTRTFTVAGFFEDAFMGSAMIDMKSFLICAEDFFEVENQLAVTDKNDVLAKSGAMLHIDIHAEYTIRKINQQIQSETRVPLFTEFSYTRNSIFNYMILLQTILCGVMFVFSLVLIATVFIVIAHTLSGILEQEKKNMAAFKTLGITAAHIRISCILIYSATFLFGILLGAALGLPLAKCLARALVSSTGFLIEVAFPQIFIILFSFGLLFLLALYLFCATKKIARIPPVHIYNGAQELVSVKKSVSEIAGELMLAKISIREVATKKSRYVGVLFVSILLVIFLSVIGKIASWLGPNGEGLANAFSVAEHDLGVQPFNAEVPMDEIERAVNWYSPIKEKYELAMQSVSINGFATTTNVLSDTTYFHILSGSECGENEILITHTIANELNLKIGDKATVSSRGRTTIYTVSGIYACANGMGNNIGMSTEGYSKIGDITGFVWCVHFIQENDAYRDYEMEFLKQNYSGIDVHTNGWSGLSGIVRLMRTIIILCYAVATVFILISAMLTTQKLLQSESSNLAIYKSVGFTDAALRISFSLRFLLVVIFGGIFGTVISLFVSSPLVSAIFKTLGIGEFKCGISFLSVVLPILAVTVAFVFSAWIFSGKIKRASIVQVIRQEG